MNTKPSVENLDGLIQKIRQEGIERAKLDADAILAAAKQQATGMLQASQFQAEQLVREADEQIQKDAMALRQAQERAARDLLLEVRTKLNDVLRRLMQRECGAALDGPALGDLIRTVAAEWMRHGGAKDIELLLNERDAQALSESFVARLQTELAAGIDVKAHPSVHAGFKIGGKGDSMRFDFTDEALAESLASYLNPRFAGVFDGLRRKKDGA